MDPIRKYYLKVCVLCYVIWIVLFEAVGTYASGLETVDLTLALDRLIPLVPEFVWPYHLCYLVPLLLVFATTDPHRINRAIFSFFLASLIGFVCYLLLPISFPRPALGSGYSERFLAFAYSIDFYPGANKLPSLHVSMAWIVFLGCRRQRFSRTLDFALLVLAVLISVSTLLVKQHIVLDVVFGLVLGFLAWSLTSRYYERVANPALPAPEAFGTVLRGLLPLIAGYVVIIFVVVGLIEAGVW